MKPTRSLTKIIMILVVLTAAAVPASQFYKTSVLKDQAVESAAVPLLISSANDAAHNLAGSLIPYQAKPWLEASAKESFRADMIPYQAKPWLEPPTTQSFRGDAIPYQAKPWLDLGTDQ
jgi:hypothetical protein